MYIRLSKILPSSISCSCLLLVQVQFDIVLKKYLYARNKNDHIIAWDVSKINDRRSNIIIIKCNPYSP